MLSLSHAEVKDAESLRFIYSAEQGYDTSCGLTSLACLMDTYWGIPADKFGLASGFLAKKVDGGDYTVSFADMTRVLKAKGFGGRRRAVLPVTTNTYRQINLSS